MTPTYWYIDAITDAINSPHTTDAESLREPAAAYNLACREANRRLREVGRLLRTGLRTEAVQVADQEPKLLDLVGELDLPAAEEWQGMAAQWGLDLPPELMLDIAAELNSAYAELMPLEQLLRTHRRLAIARAPMRDRIQVLRKLVDADPLAEGWRADLEAYDRVRLSQVRVEVNQAANRGDASELRNLLEELKSPEWTVELPSDLVQLTKANLNTVAARRAREGLANLAPELDAAFCALDAVRLRGLAEKWESLSKTAGLTPDDPLTALTKPALDWLVREQEALQQRRAFESTLAKLNDALESQAPRQRLENLLHRCDRFALPIPELLEARVRQRLEAFGLQDRRRTLVLAGISVALLAMASSGIFLYMRSLQHQNMVSAHAERLATFANDGKWSEVQSYLDGLPEGVQREAGLAEFSARAEVALQEESDRAEETEALLASLEAFEEGTAPPESLVRARSLVKTPSERTRLEVLEQANRRAFSERQKLADKKFIAWLEEWSAKVKQVSGLSGLEGVDLQSMVAELQAELPLHSAATFELRIRADPLLVKLRSLARQQDRAATELDLVAQLTESVGQLDSYTSSLKAVADSLNESEASVQAKRVLDQEAAWGSVAKWTSFWSRHAPAWERLNHERAAALLAEGDALTKATRPNPLGDQFELRRPFLQGIAGRKREAVEELKEFVLKDQLLNEVWMVVHKNQIYYCPKEPEPGPNKISFDYLTNYSGATAHRELFRQNVQHFGLSPQHQCSRELAGPLSRLTDENWDQTFFELATAVRRHAQANPYPMNQVLAIVMLSRIFKVGRKGSYLLDQAYAPIAAKLDESGVDLSVFWFLPENSEAESARRVASGVLAGLDDFATCYREARKKSGDRCRPPALYSWIGCLQRSDFGWVCRPDSSVRGSGDLFVAVPLENGRVELVKAATIDRSATVNWDRGLDRRAQLLGAPLFFSPNSLPR